MKADQLRKNLLLVLPVLFTIIFNPGLLCCEENSKSLINSLVAPFHAYVENYMKNKQAPGTAIAIVVNGQIVSLKGFGVTKAGSSDPVGIHTRFRLASLSKSFAAVLTGLLVEDGVLDWDDRAAAYLPGFSLADSAHTNNLTIRHILSHTSGLIPHAYDNLIEAGMPFGSIACHLKNTGPVCPVGKCYAYQNVVYGLIGPVIEAASGQTYEQVLRQRLIDPMGMTDVSLSKKELIAAPSFACPHIKKEGKWLPVGIRETYYNVAPAAGINASIHDMGLWLKGLASGRSSIISAKIIKEISTPLITTEQEIKRFNWQNRLQSASYGMGWRIFNYAGHTMVYHSGRVRGFQAGLGFLPGYKTGVVVLQNGWFGSHFVYKFMDIYLGLE